MDSYLIRMFGVSLLLTWIIETAMAYAFGFCSGKKILLVILANALTNPLAVLLCWGAGLYLPDVFLGFVQLAVEAAVIIAEAGIYYSFAKCPQWEIGHPVIFAVAANVFSWLFGICIMPNAR